MVHSGERYNLITALRHPWITRDLDSPCPLTKMQEFERYEQETQFRKGMMSIFFLSRISYKSKSETDSLDFMSAYKKKLDAFVKDQETGKKTAEPGPRDKDNMLSISD